MTDTRVSFARRVKAAKPRAKHYDIWDTEVSGLGLRVYPSGVRSFVLRRQLRNGRIRSVTLGRVECMSVAEARRQARRTLPTLLDMPGERRGPRYPGRAMSEFAAEFLERYARYWKPSTRSCSALMVRNHILPAFGHLAVDAVTVEHVRDWFAFLADRPGCANRAVPVLSVMMRMAEVWGYRAHNTNPCKRIRRYRMPAKEHYLSEAEMARLNAVLARDEFYRPQIVAVIRLLMLTGCRAGEILGLQWNWIRGRRIGLPDAKSGLRTVWLCAAARAILDAVPRYAPDCPFVFPARPPSRPLPMAGIGREWSRIRAEAGLPGVRLHDWRSGSGCGRRRERMSNVPPDSVSPTRGWESSLRWSVFGIQRSTGLEPAMQCNFRTCGRGLAPIGARRSPGPRRAMPGPSHLTAVSKNCRRTGRAGTGRSGVTLWNGSGGSWRRGGPATPPDRR